MPPKKDDQSTLAAGGKAKIAALFADTLDHVSATVGDLKAMAAVILDHIENPTPLPPSEPEQSDEQTAEEESQAES